MLWPMTVPEPAWVDALRAQGMTAAWTGAGHCWVRSKRVAALRYPADDLGPLGASERRELLWKQRAAVLQYYERPGAEPANAVLYLCDDKEYSLQSLSSNNRSKVRRALKRMEVRQVTVDEVLATGYAPYLDTRERQGTTPMTPDEFRANWERQRVVPDREIWAAVIDGEIAAFGAVHRCGRWAAISATVSSRKHQRDYPNHALFFTILEHLMSQPGVESASYGLSSLRGETARDSLHHFKLSVGLQAVPIVRKVEVHPVLRPAVNRGTLAAARAARRRAPTARLPMAACGTLEFLLGVSAPAPELAEDDRSGADGSP